MSVEVERKFVCDPNTQNKLREIGAVSVGQCQFQDQYFDSPDFKLTLKDCWLRCRRGCWELKCPTNKKMQERGGKNGGERLCSRYRELTSLPQIIAKVREVMIERCGEDEQKKVVHVTEENEGDKGETENHSDKNNVLANHRDITNATGSDVKNKVTGTKATKCLTEKDNDHSWLVEFNLVPFAVFTTERCSFYLGEEGEEGRVRVDLDQADFGFCVGEIEVLVPEGKEVDSALRKIERTAQMLGLSDDQRVPGKMDAYLQKYCPEHYAKLISAKIL